MRHWKSQRLLESAQLALSPSLAAAELESIFAIAPNPFEQGRANETAKLLRNWSAYARPLIWC